MIPRMSDDEVRALVRNGNRDWPLSRTIRVAKFHGAVSAWADWPGASDHQQMVAIRELLAIYQEAEQAVMAS